MHAPENCYRMPWSVADNPITWLEPTRKCNIHCDGCYRSRDPHSDRPLAELIEELEQVRKLRKSDGISIAGGEPLIYPHIVELVGHVAKQGWKPVIITNGVALTPELVGELQRAGLTAFTLHIDSHQHRPGWDGKSETELNELRTHYAQMIHKAGRGKVACSINTTIYPDTVKDVSVVTRWAQEHLDLVQMLVFILFRQAKASENFDYYGGSKKLDVEDGEKLVYFYPMGLTDEPNDVMTEDVVAQVKAACPGFEPNAYLNSTRDSRVVKFLFAGRVGTRDKVLGYTDAKFAEVVQVGHHLLFGTYLAYPKRAMMRNLQFLLPLAVANRGLRRIFGRWVCSPSMWFRSLRTQTITILQPPDVHEDGSQSMCDGCPDTIYYKGRLIHKCRLEEIEQFGDYVRAVPREQPLEVTIEDGHVILTEPAKQPVE